MQSCRMHVLLSPDFQLSGTAAALYAFLCDRKICHAYEVLLCYFRGCSTLLAYFAFVCNCVACAGHV
ncbi:hypothetical protein XELAEV_18032030mg [Xenopus laevis]|uniref:Uncharacterized protein n=1 Tax=Xenopus laevis TaxID=8355 RepID=A0A974CPY4_XENLA|nr:hypothetical protein XELAEV_18032030mg [Xenopus laevis]